MSPSLKSATACPGYALGATVLGVEYLEGSHDISHGFEWVQTYACALKYFVF